MSDLIYRWIPGTQPLLILLHGTGGDENDLVPLGQALLPGAGILSPRGKILENGMPRYFRRLREGVFDLEDLRFRTEELSEFVSGFEGKKIAVGLSNGANIAASVLLSKPEVFDAAVLFRAMVPFEPEKLPDLNAKRILLSSGRQDPLVPVSNTERLSTLLRSAGADVTQHWEPGGHGLTNHELPVVAAWLEQTAQALAAT